MSNLIGSRIAGGNTAYHRAESDFYPTPPEPTIALLDFLELDRNCVIWECAAGEGHMTETIKKRGYKVLSTDISSGVDYLKSETPFGVDFIITNPPFSLADKFIVKSLERGIPFAFLLKSQFFHAKKGMLYFMLTHQRMFFH